MSSVAKNKEFAEWIEEKFRIWRANQSSRKAGVAGFARHLDVSRDNLNKYFGGTTPEGENLDKIAGVLGDEAYDLAGVPRPNPKLRKIKQAASQMSDLAMDKFERVGAVLLRSNGDLGEEDKQDILEILEEVEGEEGQGDGDTAK